MNSARSEEPIVGPGDGFPGPGFHRHDGFLHACPGHPISLLALRFAIVGLIAALFTTGASLRWSLGGIAASCLL